MNVYFTSDWHLDHRAITKYRTIFKTSEENNSYFLDHLYPSKVKKRDIVWFLGDMAFSLDSLNKLANLPGDKRIVVGNHDTEHVTMGDIVNAFGANRVFSLVKKYGFWLSHAPIAEQELRGKICVHGHTHNHVIDDSRYFSVCPEVNGYNMVTLDQIKSHLLSTGLRKE